MLPPGHEQKLLALRLQVNDAALLLLLEVELPHLLLQLLGVVVDGDLLLLLAGEGRGGGQQLGQAVAGPADSFPVEKSIQPERLQSTEYSRGESLITDTFARCQNQCICVS